MRPDSVVHVRFNPAPITSAGTADGALSLRAAAILALLALGGGASAGPLPRADAVFPPQDGRGDDPHEKRDDFHELPVAQGVWWG